MYATYESARQVAVNRNGSLSRAQAPVGTPQEGLQLLLMKQLLLAACWAAQ